MKLHYRYDVKPFQWYKLIIKIAGSSICPYKSGTLEIIDIKKTRVFPIVKLPNIIFTNTDKVEKISDLDNLKEFTIYFKNDTKFNKLDINCDGISIEYINLTNIEDKLVKKQISIFRLRRLYDLEFLDYYIKNLQLTVDTVFLDRLNGQLVLSKNPFYFDTFISKLTLDRPIINLDDDQNTSINVLYLLHASPQYEHIGYTIRSHQLLKNTVNSNLNIHPVTRYGYPFDRPDDYYIEKSIDNISLDGLTYLKLLNGTDNMNENSLVTYLEKYVVKTILLAIELNIQVIHATTNYWNGVAGLYAAKYLGIPFIYEVRGVWSDSEITFKPEIYKSDFLEMKDIMEILVMQKADHIITINENLKNDIVLRGINGDKISIICNCVDTDMFNSTNLIATTNDRDHLLTKFNADEFDLIIGYIGSILGYEGLEYIIMAIKVLKDVHNIKAKFILVGDGIYKKTIIDLVNTLSLTENFEYIGKVDYSEVVMYYDIFDLIIYPRKDLNVCRTTSSSKIFEAMSMGKPIIVSDLPAYNEIINNGINGILFNPDDVKDLVKKILLLMQKEELRNSIGTNARNWVIKNRSWLAVGKTLNNIYCKLLDRPCLFEISDPYQEHKQELIQEILQEQINNTNEEVQELTQDQEQELVQDIVQEQINNNTNEDVQVDELLEHNY